MTYRDDDLDALRSRLLSLQQELAHIDASAGSLKDRRDAVSEEIDATRLRIAGHPPVQAASPLDAIRVASPCKADWNVMTGDDRVRFCGTCAKNVYNLSAMTREDAERLLRETEGRVCTRFFKRADGTILTQDCPIGGERKSLRRLALATAGGAALVAASVAARGAMLAAPPAPALAGVSAPYPGHTTEVTRVVNLGDDARTSTPPVPTTRVPPDSGRGSWTTGAPLVHPITHR